MACESAMKRLAIAGCIALRWQSPFEESPWMRGCFLLKIASGGCVVDAFQYSVCRNSPQWRKFRGTRGPTGGGEFDEVQIGSRIVGWDLRLVGSRLPEVSQVRSTYSVVFDALPKTCLSLFLPICTCMWVLAENGRRSIKEGKWGSACCGIRSKNVLTRYQSYGKAPLLTCIFRVSAICLSLHYLGVGNNSESPPSTFFNHLPC